MIKEQFKKTTWYRLIKVVFILIFLISLLGFNVVFVFNGGLKTVSQLRTKITCLYGSKKVFSPSDANITINKYDLDYNNLFDYKKYFEGYNEFTIRSILEKCYEKDISSLDIFAIQRIYEIRGEKTEEQLTDTDKAYIDSQIKKITSGYKTNKEKSAYLDYSIKLFDIVPVLNYDEFIKKFIIGNLIIIAFFWLIRELFFYILFGDKFSFKFSR